MNKANLSLIVPLILVAAVIVTTPVMVTEDAFARYERHTSGDVSQAASVRNSCLNPTSDSNTNDNIISNDNCGGTLSQQGKSGQASTPTTIQNANPRIEVQRSTQSPGLGSGSGGNTTTSCLQCFNVAGFNESAFLTVLQNDSRLTSLNNGNPVTSLDELCNLINVTVSNQDVQGLLVINNAMLAGLAQVPTNIAGQIFSCYLNLTNQ
jgi:hypothetical protein